tara:strand:+ start:53482 stop:53856 length:375 start_codon:yes stop_codon:yes gene_type:complete
MATLGLGGKSANSIFSNANFVKAFEGTAMSILLNQGEVCESGARLFVHRSAFEKFVGALKERFEGIKVGDPLDPAIKMGSQVSRQPMERILGYIDLAVQVGARIITVENGWLIPATSMVALSLR